MVVMGLGIAGIDRKRRRKGIGSARPVAAREQCKAQRAMQQERRRRHRETVGEYSNGAGHIACDCAISPRRPSLR